NTNNLEPMLAFWQGEVGLALDHVLPIQRGMKQHRHDANGSVLKMNHYQEKLPDNPQSGYAELLIAREGLSAPRAMADPEGNRVSLVPLGTHGISQIGIRLKVRDMAKHRAFYADALGLEEMPYENGMAFKAAETVLLFEQSADAPSDVDMRGHGW